MQGELGELLVASPAGHASELAADVQDAQGQLIQSIRGIGIQSHNSVHLCSEKRTLDGLKILRNLGKFVDIMPKLICNNGQKSHNTVIIMNKITVEIWPLPDLGFGSSWPLLRSGASHAFPVGQKIDLAEPMPAMFDDEDCDAWDGDPDEPFAPDSELLDPEDDEQAQPEPGDFWLDWDDNGDD